MHFQKEIRLQLNMTAIARDKARISVTKAMTAIFPYEATLEYSDDIVLQRSHVHKLQSAFTNLSYFEALLHAQYLGL